MNYLFKKCDECNEICSKRGDDVVFCGPGTTVRRVAPHTGLNRAQRRAQKKAKR